MCPPEVVRWSTVTHKKKTKNRLSKFFFIFLYLFTFGVILQKMFANNLKLSAAENHHRLMLSVGKKKKNKTNK